MNFSIIIHILGWVLNFEGLFLGLPCIVSLIYREPTGYYYFISMLLCLFFGILATRFTKRNTVYYAKEGFVAVALSWIVLSLFGALPFYLSGEIPSFTDALFETISGFTTTGASILTNVEALSHTSLFWRSFTHWIGGMGVLVFILAILPLGGGYNMYLMRAESPGPQVGKLVPKVRTTALILYGIYFCITIVQIVLLLLGGMPLFDAITLSFGSAGTGGFAIKNSGIADYSNYSQTIITIFMIIFGVNFNVYYLFLTKKVKQALKCEELRWYLGIIFLAIVLISYNTRGFYDSIYQGVHHAAFTVGSIITTTGYSTVDFNLWPELSRYILILLMICGACAGSTGGGIKVSRIIIMLKAVKNEISYLLHPRSVRKIKIEGRTVGQDIIMSTLIFLVAYCFIFGVSLFLVTLDNFDFTTNFTSVLATFNNIGPGLNQVGPTSNFSAFSSLSKFVLMFDMLAGRLELFPMLLLFAPSTWKK